LRPLRGDRRIRGGNANEHIEIDMLRLELWIQTWCHIFRKWSEVRVWRTKGVDSVPKVHPKGYQIHQNDTQGDQGALKNFNFTPNEGHSLPKPSPSLPQTTKVVQSDPQMGPKTSTKWSKIDNKTQTEFGTIFAMTFSMELFSFEWLL